MRLTLHYRPALIGLSLLATGLIAGCQTGSIGTDLEAKGATGACKVWPGVTYHSKKDQPDTVASARSNNRARTAYCAGTGETK